MRHHLGAWNRLYWADIFCRVQESYVVYLNNLSRNTYYRGSVIFFQEVKKPLLCTNTGVVCLTEGKSIGYQTLPTALTLTLNDSLITKMSA